ncbi:chloride channel protein CLC-b-like [Wolffia australiana]
MEEEGAHTRVDGDEGRGHDQEWSSMEEPLLKKTPSLTSTDLAMVGAQVSHMESLDYEIIENDLFQDNWRSRSREEILQYIFLKWMLAFLIGLLTGGIAALINLAVENIAGQKMITVSALVDQKRYFAGLSYLTLVNLALTSVAAILCVGIAPTAAGPGIPEIKAYLNGVDTPDMFSPSVLFVKIIGSIGAVSSGLDLGKEGPLVHIGACIAAQLGQRHRRGCRWLRHFDNDRDRRDLITMGASSGVCAAFRAPVGGVLFALEEVATWWRPALLWRTFFSTAIVVVVLRGATELCKSGRCGLFGRGGLILFDVSNVEVHYYPADILPIIAVGVIGGILGSLYNFLLHKVLRLYSLINEKGKAAKLLLSLSVSIFTSVFAYSLPFFAKCSPNPANGSIGNLERFNCPAGYYNELATLLHSTNDDAVRRVFSTATAGEFGTAALTAFFAFYCVLGLITFGIAVPSGLFLPIILMGSGYGRLIAVMASGFIKMDQGLYAVLGAAALMAGSMRMTVSLCVIFLELTNNLLLLPITMIVLLIAKTVGDCFNPSIYEIILELKGLPFLQPNPEPWMRNLTVGELAAAKPAVVSVSSVEKVSRLMEVLTTTSHSGFPVVDRCARTMATELHGLVLRSHIIAALRKKWFLKEGGRMDEWKVREVFGTGELAERAQSIEEMDFTAEEMEMYVDLHPFINLTAHTVVDSTSVSKAVVLFRQVALRHLLIVAKYPRPEASTLVGILTRQDLRAHNILNAFPDIASRKASGNREKFTP